MTSTTKAEEMNSNWEAKLAELLDKTCEYCDDNGLVTVYESGEKYADFDAVSCDEPIHELFKTISQLHHDEVLRVIEQSKPEPKNYYKDMSDEQYAGASAWNTAVRRYEENLRNHLNSNGGE